MAEPKHPREELTYLMIKPDGVKRGLTGEIIRRVEQRGLKIVGIKMIKPDRKMIDDHYPKDENWIRRLGGKTAATYEKFGFNLEKEMGTVDLLAIGKRVREWLIDYMMSAPLVGVAIRGTHAVTMVRKIAGETMPSDALLGTIRGDFSVDSAALANKEKRAVMNIVHVSETQEEAEHEIKHWFGGLELFDYERTDEMI